MELRSMATIDRPKRRAIRGPYKRPMASPFRRFAVAMEPIGHYLPAGNNDELAATILKRVRSNRNCSQAGSYLLGGDDGAVYVLAECSNTTLALVAAHSDWNICLYGSGPRVSFPTIEYIVDDLDFHFVPRETTP
jgi:hypothetical protein